MTDWRTGCLGEFIRQRKEFVQIDDVRTYIRCRAQLHARGVVLRDTVAGAEIKTKRQQVCRAGDFLVAEIDAKVGGFGIVPPQLDGAVVSSHYFLFEIDESHLERRFLDYFVRTAGFQDQVAAQGSTNYAAIRPQHVLGYKIRMPPIPEQRRIVARIEELATKIAEARGLRDNSNQQVKALESTLIGSMVFHPRFPSRTLAEIIAPESTISYGVLVPGADVDEGVPFVRVQDLMLRDHPSHPNKSIAHSVDAQYARTRLQGGEVLVAVVGATIGKIGIVPESWRGANIARAVCRVMPGPEVDRDYLVAVLRSKPSQNHFNRTTRTLAQPTLNVGQLELTPVPVPALSEQRRIVADLDSQQSRIDALKRLQSETAAELDALLPSILDKAFKGEL
ncbi:MAG: restriction endonuclease subunit S [Verrucomicrobiota bacterium]